MRLIHFPAPVLLVLICTIPALSKNYYVSPLGDDAHDGSISSPLQQIAFATCGGAYACSCATNNPNRITAGDTLFVRGGKYPEHNIRMANTGTSAAWIVIKAYPNETDTIDCQKNGPGFNVGTSQANNYVVMDGLFIKDPLQAGIRIGENYQGNHWIIKNCRFEGLVQSDNSACVFLSSSNTTLVDNCTMTGTDNTNLNYCGVQIFRGDGSITITNCDISHFGEGIFYKHCSLGSAETVIKNNFIHDNKANGLWISSDHVTMQNNLVVNNNNSGISLWEDAGGTGGSNSSMLHNTVYNQRYTMTINWGGQYGQNGDHGARNDTLVDNVFYGNNGELGSYCVWAYAPDSAFVNNPPDEISDNNCYYNAVTSNVVRWQGALYTLANWKTVHSTLDKNSVQGQPVFANPSGTLTTIADFRLLAGSGYRAASDGADMGANIDSIGLRNNQISNIHDREPRGSTIKTGPRDRISLRCLTVTGSLKSIKGPVFDTDGRKVRKNQIRSCGIVITENP
jgi:hypothetical protein